MALISNIVILCMAASFSLTQPVPVPPQDFLGKWQMIKMDIKDGLYFDVANPDSSFKRFRQLILDSRAAVTYNGAGSVLSKEDSLSIKTDFDAAFGQFRQLFIEFKDDSRYLTNQNGTDDITKIVEGIYFFDKTKRTIRLTQTDMPAREMLYELKNNVLTFRLADNKALSAISFRKAG